MVELFTCIGIFTLFQIKTVLVVNAQLEAYGLYPSLARNKGNQTETNVNSTHEIQKPFPTSYGRFFPTFKKSNFNKGRYIFQPDRKPAGNGARNVSEIRAFSSSNTSEGIGNPLKFMQSQPQIPQPLRQYLKLGRGMTSPDESGGNDSGTPKSGPETPETAAKSTDSEKSDGAADAAEKPTDTANSTGPEKSDDEQNPTENQVDSAKTPAVTDNLTGSEKPEDAEKPSDPEKSVDEEKSGDPNKPVDAEKSGSEKPPDAETESDSKKAAEKLGDPENSDDAEKSGSGKPLDEKASDSEKPAEKSSDSEKPAEKSSDSENPADKSSDSEKPADVEKSGSPEKPADAEKSGSPEEPDAKKSNDSEKPVDTEKPSDAENPSDAGKTGDLEKPADNSTAEKSADAEKLGNAKKPTGTDKSGNETTENESPGESKNGTNQKSSGKGLKSITTDPPIRRAYAAWITNKSPFVEVKKRPKTAPQAIFTKREDISIHSDFTEGNNEPKQTHHGTNIAKGPCGGHMPKCLCRTRRPVCGSDYRTYASQCQLECFRTCKPALKVIGHGYCVNAPKNRPDFDVLYSPDKLDAK